MSQQLKTRYDIIINGGGIVGFTLLNLIKTSPYLTRSKVLLIEQAKKPSFKQQPRNVQGNSRSSYHDDNNFSNRVSSITMASRLALKNLGTWDTIKPFAKDVKSIKVWNYDYSRKIVFTQSATDNDKSRGESDVMFSTVENNRLSSALLENIHSKRNGDESIAWNMTLKQLKESLHSGLVDVEIENKDTSETFDVSAPLILGCDGNQSKIRQLTQMHYREFDLKKTAVVGTVKLSKQATLSIDNNVAYQRFSAEKNTVAALLPLDSEYSSFVISAPTDYAKHLNDCDDETFTSEFNRLLTTSESPQNPILRVGHEVANALYDGIHNAVQLLQGSLQSVVINSDFDLDEVPRLEGVVAGSRASFPLIFGTTSPRMTASLPGQSRRQVALLGDAAHRVHPLAGQGLNLGIQDAVELVRQLETLAKAGEPLFADTELLAKALKRYECKRQAFVIPMSASILLMQDAFELAPSRLISSVNKCNPIKNVSVRIANGCM